MSLERVDWHLWNWSQWMQGLRVGSGYMTHASGDMGKSGSIDFDAMVAIADARCAEAVDAAIDELPLPQHLAVHHVIMASVFRLRNQNVQELFLLAKVSLSRSIPARGIV